MISFENDPQDVLTSNRPDRKLVSSLYSDGWGNILSFGGRATSRSCALSLLCHLAHSMFLFEFGDGVTSFLQDYFV